MKLLLLTLAAAFGIAQDLSPNGRTTKDLAAQAQAVLDRAREHVVNTIDRLPRYVCLENIERAYLDPIKAILPKANFCPAIESKLSPNLRLNATDRVSLEVAVGEGGEVDSWPQASKFDTHGIDIVESGPISSGAFGSNLSEVFQNPGARFDFTGAGTRGGPTLFSYHYAVPIDASDYMVRLLDGARWKTEYSGDLEIAADSAELISLTIETGLLPPYSGMCRARTINVYHHVKVGNGEFLIPVTSTLRTIHPDGTATESTTTFSGCHEYTVETSIRFDADDTAPPAPAATVEIKPLPAADRIGLRLDSPIDTEKAAAGDIVWARIENPRRKPKAQKPVPADARVRGRIMRAMHHMNDHRGFDIEVAFDTLEIGAGSAPFAGVAVPSKPRVGGVDISLQGTATGGLFKIRTKRDKVLLPAGIQFEWMTLTPPKLEK